MILLSGMHFTHTNNEEYREELINNKLAKSQVKIQERTRKLIDDKQVFSLGEVVIVKYMSGATEKGVICGFQIGTDYKHAAYYVLVQNHQDGEINQRQTVRADLIQKIV